MRALVGPYLVIGIVFLALGFIATGPCRTQNTDVVNDIVFVLGWPVYLSHNLAKGDESATQWLHREACEGGVVASRRQEPAPPQSGSSRP